MGCSMSTKRTLATSLAVLALAVAGCGGEDDESTSGSAGAPAGAASTSTVDINDFKYDPKVVKVAAGDAITFTNADKAKHNAQTDSDADHAFDSGDLEQGDSKEVTFDEAGTYAYYCIYHRFMTGTVEVSE